MRNSSIHSKGSSLQIINMREARSYNIQDRSAIIIFPYNTIYLFKGCVVVDKNTKHYTFFMTVNLRNGLFQSFGVHNRLYIYPLCGVF